MTLSLPVKSDPSQRLSYRLASQDDLPFLRELRIECGWGIPKLEKYLGDPDWPHAIFTLHDAEDGTARDVGMAAWVLHDPNDLEAASRETRTVYLSSLFIRREYQRGGLGTTAMDILERVAIEKFNASRITLDTVAYSVTHVRDGDVTIALEDKTLPGKTIPFYEKRGYRQYRPHKPAFPEPQPDNPGYLLTAIYLAKDAE